MQNSSQVLVDANSLRKKRGPYNKLSKKKRLEQVRQLYFEEGYSIVDAAKTLDANRNTVSADVKYWIGEFEIQSGGDEITDYFYKQKSFFDAQNFRLLKKLKTEPDLANELKLEKLLLGVSDRQMKFYLKFSPMVKRSPKISKKLVKKIVRELAFDEFSFSDQDELIREIICKAECDVETAKSIVSEMEKLGLNYARNYSDRNYFEKTHVNMFAAMCGYLSDKESSNILKEITPKIKQKLKDYEKSLDEYEEEFGARYGNSRNWSKEVWKEYVNGKNCIDDPLVG